MRNTMRATAWLVPALALASLVGCGGGGDATAPGGEGSAPSSVRVDGSSTVFLISQAAQIGFKKAQPDIKVTVGFKGTGGGFGRYLRKEIDIVDASRQAKPEEEKQAKEAGLEWTRFLVGHDGITVVKNPQNDFVKSLSVEQLKKLFRPGSTVMKWNELDPSWPDREIILYAPDDDSGTYEFFTEAVNGEKGQRTDIQTSPDDNTLVRGVSGDADGLGYFGYAYYVEYKDQLDAVPIQNGSDAKPIAPSPETILDGSYAPLSRPLFIYVNSEALGRPEVESFVRYYLDNIDELARKAGYVPPTAEEKSANAEALAAATGSAEKSEPVEETGAGTAEEE